jgi:predicted neuraminidase
MPAGVPAAHASSLLSLHETGGDLLAAWFAGTRESGADVQIWMARYDAATSRWQEPQAVLNRHNLSAQHLGFGIRRLGNPVLWQDNAGRIHVFVVATGLGGWAASRVLHATLRWADGQHQVAAAQVLPLSPLWNISTLVRTNPVAMADGGALLPLYFELGLKYPMALRLDPQGRWVEAVRISSQRGGLQPAIVPTSATRGLALMRDFSAQAVRAARTEDGGHTWADLPAAQVPNSNSSVAALRLPDGSLVMAANPLAQGRHELALLRSQDGEHWQPVAMLEQAPAGAEFSYPALSLSRDGRALHVSYTWQRQRIRHRVFDLTQSPP